MSGSPLQIVFGTGSTSESSSNSNENPFHKDTLIYPLYAASLSAAFLLLHVVVSSARIRRFFKSSDAPREASILPSESDNGLRARISGLGGPTVFGFMFTRVLTSLALLVLANVPFDKDRREEFALGLTSFYLTILAIFSISTSLRWSRVITRHFNLVSLITFLIYAYRDLVPLGTFTSKPLDEAQGWLIWTKVSILALMAIVLPLFIPRVYSPVNTMNPKGPSPEQTASLISFTLYLFLDPVIAKGYRTPQLPYEDIPPLPDSDEIEYLKARHFRHIDPALGVKKRNLFWSLMHIFWPEYSCMSLLLILFVVASFATPLGVNKLLSYLEDPNAGAVVRPWVWIAWLFMGPEISSITWEYYVFIGTRTIVRTEAILTQLVFEHALRIRLKAETDSSKDSTAASDIATLDSESGLATPSRSLRSEASSEDDDETSASTENATLHSAGPSEVSAVPSNTETLSADSETPDKRKVKVTTKEPSSESTSPAEKKGKEKDTRNMIGKINNLVTTDLQNIVDAKSWIHLVVFTPLEVALCIVFLYVVLGWSAFVGLGVIILCFPLPGFLGKMTRKFSKRKMVKTDGRVQVVSEVMSVLRMIKMFGWEKMMNERIKDKREEEMVFVRWMKLVDLSTFVVNYIIPFLTMLATFTTYVSISTFTLIMKQPLTSSKVFSSMVVFDKFSRQLQLLLYQLTKSITGKVSLDRITEFLYETELLDAHSENESKESEPHPHSVSVSGVLPLDTPSRDKIGFRNATFSWSKDSADGTLTPSKRQFLLKIDELFFQRGCINLILGPTGSGKTSLLLALLSELHFIPSGPDSWYNLPRTGGVAYAAQESWVQNATIKENIVFGSDFDEERYKKVIYQCAMERDLALFDAGDETEVGEKGLTLSGGQKARVTLARAIYSKAEIILLDDVLAALDVHTSKWIVDKCFRGDLIKGRTVVLVSHNVVLTKPIAGFVVSLRGGRIVSQGSVSDALFRDEALAAEVKIEEQELKLAEEQVDAEEDSPDKKLDGKLIVAEEVELGRLGWSAVKLFLSSLGGSHPVLFFIAFLGINLVSEVSQLVQPWYLGHWADQYELHRDDPASVNVVYYISIYACILAFSTFSFSLAAIVFLFGSIRASKTIHKRLVESILGTTLRWLDTTPTSRVIARCTKDMSDVDGSVPSQFSSLVSMTFMMIGSFLAVIIYSPAFIGPALIIAFLGLFCGNVYVKAQLPVKRIQSNAKAPVLGHFGAAIAGLTSIRAYGAEESFKTKSMVYINYYSRPSRVFYNLNRWVDIRIDALGSLFQASLATYLVYLSNERASTTGFSLNMAVAFSGVVLYWVRVANMLEVSGNSLERINRYIEIEQEPKPTPEGNPPAYWPSSGELRVEKLSASYSPGGPKVLRNLSFAIKSGERIGVVGRTGSGKSSLMLSLLRLIFTEGEIYYDGLPVASLNLEALRTNVTIIPQVPELLSGTVRDNLDPFGQHDDATLNDSLRSAGLYSIESRDEEHRITLDTAVATSGNNLSVGQRQILALARAMVRGSKLLILDEATSAIDYKTDSVIQSSLRNELGKDVTLLIVAHRLQTIMDADKIMVLDAGSIVEFDTPKELLRVEQGKLRSLVDESADKEHLYAMANGQV
ncbi:P-loop containing nucleoside triphosphate hydrolase protein [Dendrothele bispora CBS 962.96]|uniref:P-loop containing nucleoside triphosphate hydrolase protein n=1 Tax=Dendrothele bispora (strain CBS 962.96) TaxID=1314807 RepID=A0A4S8MP63_DENBC|nr:P-loop containing nucleoside triphosphate hydrolase protein [Dendrothele bispora CBS 962.96]